MRLYELLESLDKDQKRVGQVGGEKKARKIGPVLGKAPKKHPYDGRLVGEETVQEVAPPGMEDWIKDRKADFKKRYGDRWKTVLYATAWKRHKNESVDEAQVGTMRRYFAGDKNAQDELKITQMRQYFNDLLKKEEEQRRRKQELQKGNITRIGSK